MIQIKIEKGYGFQPWAETGDAATLLVLTDTNIKSFRFKMVE
jgi:hypothetical protein